MINNLKIALLYVVCVLLLSLTKNVIALFFLTIIVFVILIKSEMLHYTAFVSFIFTVATTHDVFSAIISILPVISYFDKKSLYKIKEYESSIISAVILLLFIFGYGYIAIPIALYYYYKSYDYRIFVGTAIILLIASAYTLSSFNEKLANDIAIWAYYFLCLGVFGALIDYIRNPEYHAHEKRAESQ